MSRIGRKPVTVPGRGEGRRRRLDDPGRGAQGQALVHAPPRDRRRSTTRPASRSSSPGATTSGSDRALHGLTRSLINNMVEGVTTGYTKKLEIVGVGYQAQLKKANTVALQVGYANQIVAGGPGRGQRDRPRPDPRHRSPGPTSRPSASSPPRSARSARPSRTRARASATRARSSAARPARRSAPSKRAGSTADPTDVENRSAFQRSPGWASGRDRPPPNPPAAEERTVRVNQRKIVEVRRLRRQRHVRKRLHGTPERPRLWPSSGARSTSTPRSSTTTTARPSPRPARSTPRSRASAAYGGNKAAAAARRQGRRRAGQAGRY